MKHLKSMTERESVPMLAGMLAACFVALTTACGDGNVEPQPPPPPDPPRPTTVTVTPATASLTALGATVQLAAEVRDQSGQVMAGATVAWRSSSALVATVTASGLVTAAYNGAATITATAGSAAGTAAVTVAQEVGTVIVSPTSDTLLLADTVRLAAEAADANGHPVAGAEFAWASSDTLVGVVDRNGLVTGISEGEVEITAMSGSAAGSAQVTVVALSDRRILALLYRDAGGSDWFRSDNWLSDAPLARWHGVTTDGNGRVVELELSSNNLSGIIPPELGRLASLESLDLRHNTLSGSVPPQLGNLTELAHLSMGWNNLSGTIPPELGNLASLESLALLYNNLSGTIPPELGGLANLRGLFLNGNTLSGPIPPHIGRLINLRHLYLGGNNLTGTVPPELGDLANIGWIDLDYNALSGSLPADIGRLATLRELGLSNNTKMSGTLPSTLTNLRELEALQAGGTDLCAPDDPAFAAWLESVPKRRIPSCATAGAFMAYLTQAVQSPEYPVPLVAGEEALLRVFVTADRASDAQMPPVRAIFHVNGAETHVADIPGTSAPIPTEVDEGDLSGSANSVIPGEVVLPGLELVIEVDPDGTLDPGLSVAKRIPETGRLTFDVRPMPLFDLTVIPFLWTSDPDSTIMGIAAGMARDPGGHELLRTTRTLLPVGPLDVTAHPPVVSSSNEASALLRETRAIRVLEGGTGHYMGMMSGDVKGAAGVAGVRGRTSFSMPFASVIAHELGHNMSLWHAPCPGGARGGDSSYPYPDGSIGAWGYDFDEGKSVAPSTTDLMSYCPPPDWISDYHFTNALRFRLSDEGAGAAAVATAREPTQSLLLWGGINYEDDPFLESAFVFDAPPHLPDSAGAYEIAGRTAGGVELFSLSFTMPEVPDGDGSSFFAFALPVHAAQVADLASITLTGPGGSATLDGDTNRPMAILRDPNSGQVRGFLRDLPHPTRAAMDVAGQVAEPGLQVLFSRGIPDAAAWRR